MCHGGVGIREILTSQYSEKPRRVRAARNPEFQIRRVLLIYLGTVRVYRCTSLHILDRDRERERETEHDTHCKFDVYAARLEQNSHS